MLGASEGIHRAEGTAAMTTAKASDAFALGELASLIVYPSNPSRIAGLGNGSTGPRRRGCRAL